jgi:hypothetical protein
MGGQPAKTRSRRRIFAVQRRTGLAFHWRTAVAEARKIKDANLARTAQSTSEVGSVNECERIRQFSQNPLMKREADPGKPMISSPLNERERQDKIASNSPTVS